MLSPLEIATAFYAKSGENLPVPYYNKIANLSEKLRDSRDKMRDFNITALRLLQNLEENKYSSKVYAKLSGMFLGLAHSIRSILPDRTKTWVAENYEAKSNPHAYIEKGYRQNLNGLQDSLIEMEKAAEVLSKNIEDNQNHLNQIRQGDLSLNGVWDILTNMAAKYGIQTTEKTKEFMNKLREEMSPEEKREQVSEIIDWFHGMLERQYQLFDILGKVGRGTITVYGFGIQEYTSFMQVAGTISTLYKTAEDLSDMKTSMYAGSNIPIVMLEKAIDGIDIVLDSIAELRKTGLSSARSLDHIVTRANKLEEKIRIARAQDNLIN